MIRRTLAAVVDALAAAFVGYLAFRLAVALTPCANESNCAPLAPAAILGSLLGVAVYFGAGYALWRSSPAQKLLGVERREGEHQDS